jgi:hypothetical protein
MSGHTAGLGYKCSKAGAPASNCYIQAARQLSTMRVSIAMAWADFGRRAIMLNFSLSEILNYVW